MPDLVLTEEQVRILTKSGRRIALRDPHGNLLGYAVLEFTPEEIAEAKRRAASAKGPWYSGEEVQQRLQALEEAWQQEGGFDRARMRELLQKLRSARHP